MNAMYAILGGNDRANKRQYFTEQSELAEKTLSSSNKLLAVSTLLINPEHIRPALLRINTNGQLYDASDITLDIIDGKLRYSLNEYGSVLIGNSNEFSLQQ